MPLFLSLCLTNSTIITLVVCFDHYGTLKAIIWGIVKETTRKYLKWYNIWKEKKQGPLENYPTLNDLIFWILERQKETMSFKQKKRNRNENETEMECYATPIMGM